jgi:hypothetical protein
MRRYVLRYSKAPLAPEEHIDALRATTGLDVIDASNRMALVAGDEAVLRRKLEELGGGWTISPEQSVPLPDTRKKIG